MKTMLLHTAYDNRGNKQPGYKESDFLKFEIECEIDVSNPENFYRIIEFTTEIAIQLGIIRDKSCKLLTELGLDEEKRDEFLSKTMELIKKNV